MKNFILVATFTYPHECYVLKLILEDQDIPYYLENETMVGISPFYSNALGGIKLFVHSDYVEYVKDILENLEDSNNHLKIV